MVARLLGTGAARYVQFARSLGSVRVKGQLLRLAVDTESHRGIQDKTEHLLLRPAAEKLRCACHEVS